MKIGILIIATGTNYWKYIEPLVASIDNHFLKGHERIVHLWTDADRQYPVERQFAVKPLEWPYPTLYRYHFFLEQPQPLADTDYLFYLDVDMLVVDAVAEEILSDGIVATEHPGYAFAQSNRLPYDQDPSSTAYVPPPRYYCGGFQGERSGEFMRMAGVIRDAIDVDLKRGYIARWHDESYYNRYLFHTPPALVLSPSYCYPEDALAERGYPWIREHYLGRWQRDYQPKILALLKQPHPAPAVNVAPRRRRGLRRLVHKLKMRWRERRSDN